MKHLERQALEHVGQEQVKYVVEGKAYLTTASNTSQAMAPKIEKTYERTSCRPLVSPPVRGVQGATPEVAYARTDINRHNMQQLIPSVTTATHITTLMNVPEVQFYRKRHTGAAPTT